MKRWSRWFANAALGALLAACSDSHPDGEGAGLGPKNSTETGNPPVIDLERIALVSERARVHVIGERGAVSPGGVEIEIERLATGSRVVGDVAQDGSFDVRVDGTLGDAYRLRALRSGAGEPSEPVFVNREGASDAPEDLCAQCELPEVSWGSFGPTLDTAHSLTDCSAYLAIHTVGEQCESELPCVGDGQERQRSVVELQSQLADSELAGILEQGETSFGTIAGASSGFTIRVGAATIMIGDEPCAGAQGCEDAPAALVALRDLLEQIADQQVCRELCADQPDRVFVALACVECYPDRELCISRAPVCAEPCDSDDDCSAGAGACSAQGACEPVVCE